MLRPGNAGSDNADITSNCWRKHWLVFPLYISPDTKSVVDRRK
jgi:hypothetical protein